MDIRRGRWPYWSWASFWEASAVLQRIAENLYLTGISQAKMASIERRLARFVANERVQVSTIWRQFLRQVLAYWKGKPVQLVLDCTPFDDRATIVYVGLLVHSRVLPVVWRIMPQQEHWDQSQWDLVGELLDEVSQHLEPTDCSIIADRGLAGAPLVKLCRDRQFHYLLRGGLGTYVPSLDGRLLDALVCLPLHYPSPRPALVWPRFALAR